MNFSFDAMANKYDIFVSYRRSSSESANLIATRLRAAGYRVFFDVESLRGGKFNEQLYNVIDNCTDFLLILPENALDRCNDPEDWVRKEVLRAIADKKNIIPVMLTGFNWPKQMPEGMEELPLYQAITASSTEYFDLSIRKLIEQYLKSKPKHRVIIKKVGLIVSAIIIISLALFGIARLLSVPLSERVAHEMTDHLVRLDLLGECLDKNYKEWNTFVNRTQTVNNQQQLMGLIEDMADYVERTRLQIKEAAPTDTLNRQFSLFDTFLFACRGISALELEQEPVIAASYYSDLSADLDYLSNVLEQRDFGSVVKKMIDSKAQLSQHILAMFYYGYMEIMAKMPKAAQERYTEIASQLKSLPNDVPLNLTTDEYLQKQLNENAICERILQDLEAFVDNASAQVDELEDKLSFVDGIINSYQQIAETEEANKTELATRQEKLEAKKALTEQKKAELEELDKEYQRVFEELKDNCAIEETDDKWYKWGKIAKFATFMDTMVASRKNLNMQGIHSTSSVTPEVAYATLASMLNTFKTYHPESSDLAESAKAYYKEVSKGSRRIKGVIISATKDDVEHPVFKVGDIILTMKGIAISNYEELKTAYKKEGTPAVTFLRLSNGRLEEKTVDDCGPTDILGFSELKQ